jgi:CSLREA domain-containing protein
MAWDEGHPRQRSALARLLFVLATALPLPAAAVTPLLLIVNNSADVPDANPGDGICETAPGNGVCTLRAAIQEANAHASVDTIQLQANTTYTLTRVGADNTALNGDLDIYDHVNIVGAGPTTIIDGNGDVVGESVFQILCVGGAGANCGGGTSPPSIVNISNLTIRHGKSYRRGGAIDNVGTLTLDNCVISDNRVVSATGDFGGGIYNEGTLTLTNTVVSNNMTGFLTPAGGGVYHSASSKVLTITNSTISGNSTPGFGGGIFVHGAANLTGSTVSGNTAGTGGGISVDSYGELVAVNSTISGNYSNGDGGGLHSASYAELFNVTVTENLANADDSGSGKGGGVANVGSLLELTNSIVANNEVDIPGVPFPLLDLDDCSGAIQSVQNNIMSQVSATHCTVTGNYIAADPKLGPLQANGGPTPTHALLQGSPAIDGAVGSNCPDKSGNPLKTDQRGIARPYGAVCDIGAYEAADIIFQNGFQL